ncbi:m-AAA protease-interacting protein 1, mitochondrial [Pelobates fuscus]|uniref:m-AAA protease-interacting protein 1, mitochondrial n=1 Tax=Pelobates fuscus TaxID=191477 RepID=UPI002FE44ADA
MLRSVFRLSRYCARGPLYPQWGLPPASSLCSPGPSLYGRPYSSDPSPANRRVVVVGLPNPFIWCRTRIYFFLIRAYFDKDFNVAEFTEGAKQAFTLVSKLMSERKFEELENLVTNETIRDVQEKCTLLPDNHRDALAASSDDIMYSTTGDVAIYYDDNGRKFVSILMRFWYLTYADLPDENLEGTKVFQVVVGDKNVKDTKRLLTANYEFRREFTQGVKPNWIITRIEHPKLLD